MNCQQRRRWLVSDGTYNGKHRIDHSHKPTACKDTNECTNESKTNCADADAVQHEHNIAGKLGRLNTVLDCGGPLQIRQVDTGFQFVLDGFSGVEMKRRGLVRAFCDILFRMRSEVRCWTRLVISLHYGNVSGAPNPGNRESTRTSQ